MNYRNVELNMFFRIVMLANVLGHDCLDISVQQRDLRRVKVSELLRFIRIIWQLFHVDSRGKSEFWPLLFRNIFV